MKWYLTDGQNYDSSESLNGATFSEIFWCVITIWFIHEYTGFYKV